MPTWAALGTGEKLEFDPENHLELSNKLHSVSGGRGGLVVTYRNTGSQWM